MLFGCFEIQDYETIGAKITNEKIPTALISKKRKQCDFSLWERGKPGGLAETAHGAGQTRMAYRMFRNVDNI